MGIDKIVNVGTLGLSDAVGLTDSMAMEDAYADAAAAQTAAGQANIAYQERLFDKQTALQEPWRAAGTAALKQIQETPDFQFNADSFDMMKDPSYDFRMQEGVNALDRSAASRGRLLSGAQDRAVTRYGSDLASQEYGNAFNRSLTTYQQNLGKQQSLAGVGQVATQQIQDVGNVLGQNVSQANTDIGNAYAQGQIQTANANQAMGANLLGMAGSLGGAAIIASDIRLKDNIIYIGKEKGHNIYSWDWKYGEQEHFPTMGVLAQEVEKYAPEAIVTMENGYKAVNYTILGF